MSKRKIGIPGWMVGANSFGVTLPYAEFITNVLGGELHILSPYNGDIRRDLDLIVLPGGYDVNPLRYDELPWFSTQNPNVILEAFDNFFLKKYIEANTPIFGICRGFCGPL